MMSWIRVGLPLALLSLSSQSVSGHHPDQLCMRRSFWKDLLQGLENINPVFSPECRSEYDTDLEVPLILKPAENHKAAAAFETLSRLLTLFSESDCPFRRTQRLSFLNRLTEVLSHLQSCVKSPLSHPSHQRAIRERFHKLSAFLLEKGNSGCAWEIVHAVTRMILQETSRNHARK